MVDDAELLRRYLQSHSEPAFAEFVGRHLNLVYFTALRRVGGDAALAQEVAQAVFTLAARKARALASHATLAGWLHTTTRYLAARALRKERTRQRYEKDAAMHELTTAEPAREWERLRPVIDDALHTLDERDREAILVRFFEGRTFVDLGTSWRISQDAARMRVDRALDKLRAALERRGIRSVSAGLAVTLATQGALAAPAGLVATVSSAALATAATTSGLASLFGIMSGTKIITGAAAAVVLFTAGTAVFQHRQVAKSEIQLDAHARELSALQARLTEAERRRSAAEARAAEAERDNATLLAAIETARAKPAASRGPTSAALQRTPSTNDPLTGTLDALFPDGIIAVVDNRPITVDEVRRQLLPLIAKVQETTDDPGALMHRFYALQNSAVADLVTRQLMVKQFHHRRENEEPKQIATTTVDNALAKQLREQFNNDEAAFRAHLEAQGLTMSQYRQQIEENIIFQYMRGQQRKVTPGKRK